MARQCITHHACDCIIEKVASFDRIVAEKDAEIQRLRGALEKNAKGKGD